MNIVSLMGTVGLISAALICYILARLSEKFGAVIRMPPLYRYYYISLGLLIFAGGINWVVIGVFAAPENLPAWLTSIWFLLVAYHLPVALGTTLALLVTWRYWHWLVTELDH